MPVVFGLGLGFEYGILQSIIEAAPENQMMPANVLTLVFIAFKRTKECV